MDLNAGFCGPRIIGDYIIGPKIGSGSFAVVWKSKHRVLGSEFAIKEIDKKHFNDNLRKEISILRNIKHPNIIRLFEAIETERRVYLVLEYCEGGDLGVYISRYGRVSEDIARHFMKQLAAGLQVLRENNLIHRDLKPQNLLLSGREVTPLLKIGDFGFARYLTQGLADTLCGSPLYMAPEIIQNHRYDAKADLWSVGAICYQLVIGKPPFDGNSQLQLFQNILKSTELQFPEGSLQVLKPDYVEFCRSLLRRNPVERLTFEEFFNHRFLMGPGTPRTTINLGSSSQIFQAESLATDDQVHHEDEMKPFERGTLDCSTNDEKRGISKDYSSTFRGRDVYGIIPNVAVDKIRHSIGDGSGIHSSSQIRGSYSLDSIEGEYVLVHSNFASMEILTSSLGTSLKEGLATKACDLAPKNKDKQLPTIPMTKGLAAKFTGGSDNILHSSATASGGPSIYREAEGLSILHPSRRLQFIHQCVGALSDLAREKFNAGSFLESFSVDLVVLALWKEAWQICNSWLMESGFPKSSSGIESASEGAASSSKAEDTIDFTNPSSVSFWAEQGFISACDGTEKLSKHLHDLDGAAEMPDAMEIIFQTAIAAGKDGAADEFAGNQESAAVMYSKALHLFSFIAGEAPLLPLTPPFYLSPDSKQQILRYIKSLEYHLSRSQISQPPSTEQLPSLGTK